MEFYLFHGVYYTTNGTLLGNYLIENTVPA